MCSSPYRIAIFQADWPLQVHIKHLVEGLTDAGFIVDVYLFRTDDSVMSGDAIAQIENANLILCSGDSCCAIDSTVGSRASVVSRGARRIMDLLGLARDWARWVAGDRSPYSILPALHPRFHRPQLDKDYLLAIGVEGAGFIWASWQLARVCPVYYYSLELYINSHPKYARRRSVAYKRLERYWHKKAGGTIIQDNLRATELLAAAGISRSSQDVVLLPVSIAKSCGEGVVPLRKQFDLPEQQVMIAYIGNVEPRRNCLEMCKIASSFPPNWTLVLHGRWTGPASYCEQIESFRACPQIRFSTELVSEAALGTLIRGADVALALYKNTDVNQYHTAYASEKVALYFSESIPIVAYNYPTFVDLFSRWRCGIAVEELSQVREAIGKILLHRREYAHGASKAFDQCYDFKVAVQPLITAVRALADKNVHSGVSTSKS